MVLTPLEIEKKEFAKTFRGYNIDEVEKYLKLISRDYEKVYQENQILKNKLDMCEKQLEDYRNLEVNIREALVVAQKTAEEIKFLAQMEADNNIKEAERKAREIINAAEDEVRRKKEHLITLEQEYKRFKTQMKHLLMSYLESLEDAKAEVAATKEDDSVTEVEAAENEENSVTEVETTEKEDNSTEEAF